MKYAVESGPRCGRQCDEGYNKCTTPWQPWQQPLYKLCVRSLLMTLFGGALHCGMCGCWTKWQNQLWSTAIFN